MFLTNRLELLPENLCDKLTKKHYKLNESFPKK